TFIEDVTMAYWGWSASLPFSEQLWTISLEEQAYFLLPLLLAAYFGARNPPSLRAVVIAAAGIGAAARCAMLLLGAGHTMIWASPLHPDGFLAGVYLGVATTVAADGARRHALGYVSIAAALAALFVLMVTGPPLQYAPAEVYGYPVYALAGAALIVGIANLPLLAGTLALRPLRYLGKVSFGIYVFHALALALAESLLRRADAMSPLAHFLLGAAIAIAFAAGSYHLFERRFLALKTRFAKIRSRPV
ncbi:MAG TPA: acyltransferase family protein, partial [Stellaceae bacterium]|nr:acyltransferase family protein [Stellaceae bacterium]